MHLPLRTITDVQAREDLTEAVTLSTGIYWGLPVKRADGCPECCAPV